MNGLPGALLLAAAAITLRDLPMLLIRNAPPLHTTLLLAFRWCVAYGSIELSIGIAGVELHSLTEYAAVIGPLFWVGLTFVPLLPNLLLVVLISAFAGNLLSLSGNGGLADASSYVAIMLCFIVPEVLFRALHHYLPRLYRWPGPYLGYQIQGRNRHGSRRFDALARHLSSLTGKGGIVLSIVLGGPVLFVSLLLSPLELLLARRGWAHRSMAELSFPAGVYGEQQPKGFIVYFDGIGKNSPADTREGRNVKKHMATHFPNWRVVTAIMPYSPLNLPLTKERLTSGLWIFFKGLPESIVMLFRNIIQVLTMHDGRYRDDYAQALTDLTADCLQRAGYKPGSNQPIVFIGYSGGAGAATLVAPRLKQALQISCLTIFAIGGFFEAHPQMRDLNLISLEEPNDFVIRFGRKLLLWNWHPKRVRFPVLTMSGMTHLGPRGYLSGSYPRETHVKHVDISLSAIAKHLDKCK